MSLNKLPDQPDATGTMTKEWFHQQWATLVRVINPLVDQSNSTSTASSSGSGSGSSSTTSTSPTVTQTDQTSTNVPGKVYNNPGPGIRQVQIVVTTNAPSEAGDVSLLVGATSTLSVPANVVSKFSNIGTTTNPTFVTVSAVVPAGVFYELILQANLTVVKWTELNWSF